jgi:gamma-glutamyl:cysteine ligase YbdK (ATP-grasp superfamily)
MRYGLGQVFGLELEYMIVDRRSLDVRPIADRIIGAVGEVDRGPFTWVNELAAHVIEIKLTHPMASLDGLASGFHLEVAEIDRLLEPHGARLLPTAMHPWMDPIAEMRLWPHESGPVYAAFDRLFDCRGHGWANLQSSHINLPFRTDDEFARLHAAVRLVLPLIPALAASSPFKERRQTGRLDERLAVYKTNAARVPSVTGLLVPEPVYTEAGYRDRILEPMYRDIASLDTAGLLQEEWLNARGAIARFDRGAIEIRVVDVQECPAADLAVVMLVWRFIERHLDRFEAIRNADTTRLSRLLDRAVAEGGRAETGGIPEYGMSRRISDIWIGLYEDGGPLSDAQADAAARVILEHGNLSERILKSEEPLFQTYSKLADCLASGAVFRNISS